MKDRKGFTLIELLVVIAIIALLMSIVVPSLKTAREVAQATISRSNLRQWGLVWKLYTDNYDGRFPYWKVVGSGTYHRGSWIQAIRAYLPEDREKMLLCPTASLENPEFIQVDGRYDPEAHGGVRYAYSMGLPSAAEQAVGITEPELCSYGMNSWCANSGNESGKFSGVLLRIVTTITASDRLVVPDDADSMWRGGGPWDDRGFDLGPPPQEGEWRGWRPDPHFIFPSSRSCQLGVC